MGMEKEFSFDSMFKTLMDHLDVSADDFEQESQDTISDAITNGIEQGIINAEKNLDKSVPKAAQNIGKVVAQQFSETIASAMKKEFKRLGSGAISKEFNKFLNDELTVKRKKSDNTTEILDIATAYDGRNKDVYDFANKLNKRKKEILTEVAKYYDSIAEIKNSYNKYQSSGQIDDKNLIFDSGQVSKNYEEFIKKNNVLDKKLQRSIANREKLYSAFLITQDRYKNGKKDLGDYSDFSKNTQVLKDGALMVKLAKELNHMTKEIGISDKRFNKISINSLEQTVNQLGTNMLQQGVAANYQKELETMREQTRKFVELVQREFTSKQDSQNVLSEFFKDLKAESADAEKKVIKSTRNISDALKKNLRDPNRYIKDVKNMSDGLTGRNRDEGTYNIYKKFTEATADERIDFSKDNNMDMYYQYVGEVANLIKQAASDVNSSLFNHLKAFDDGSLRNGLEYFLKLIENTELKNFANEILDVTSAINVLTGKAPSLQSQKPLSEDNLKILEKEQEVRKKIKEQLERSKALGIDQSQLTGIDGAATVDQLDDILDRITKINNEREQSGKIGMFDNIVQEEESINKTISSYEDLRDVLLEIKRVNEQRLEAGKNSAFYKHDKYYGKYTDNYWSVEEYLKRNQGSDYYAHQKENGWLFLDETIKNYIGRYFVSGGNLDDDLIVGLPKKFQEYAKQTKENIDFVNSEGEKTKRLAQELEKLKQPILDIAKTMPSTDDFAFDGAMKDADAYGIIESLLIGTENPNVNEALNQLCKLLGIKIPEAASKGRAAISEFHNEREQAGKISVTPQIVDTSPVNENGVSLGADNTKNIENTTNVITEQNGALKELILSWIEAHKIMSKSGVESAEKIALGNLSNDFVSNSNFTGDFNSIPDKLIRNIIESATETVDTMIHSHPDYNLSAFSPEDIASSIIRYVTGIQNQIIVGIDEISVMDVSKIKDIDPLIIKEKIEQELSDLVNSYVKNQFQSINGLQSVFNNTFENGTYEWEAFTDLISENTNSDLLKKVIHKYKDYIYDSLINMDSDYKFNNSDDLGSYIYDNYIKKYVRSFIADSNPDINQSEYDVLQKEALENFKKEFIDIYDKAFSFENYKSLLTDNEMQPIVKEAFSNILKTFGLKYEDVIKTISVDKLKLSDSILKHTEVNQTHLSFPTLPPSENTSEQIHTLEKQEDTVNEVSKAFDIYRQRTEEYNKQSEKTEEIISRLVPKLNELMKNPNIGMRWGNDGNPYDLLQSFESNPSDEFLNNYFKKIPNSKKDIKEYIENILKTGSKEEVSDLIKVMSAYEGYDAKSIEHGLFRELSSKSSKQKALHLSHFANDYVAQWKEAKEDLRKLKSEINPIIKELVNSLNIEYNGDSRIEELLTQKAFLGNDVTSLFDVIKDPINGFRKILDIENLTNSKYFELINISDIKNVEDLDNKIVDLRNDAKQLTEQLREASSIKVNYEEYKILEKNTKEAWERVNAYERLRDIVEEFKLEDTSKRDKEERKTNPPTPPKPPKKYNLASRTEMPDASKFNIIKTNQEVQAYGQSSTETTATVVENNKKQEQSYENLANTAQQAAENIQQAEQQIQDSSSIPGSAGSTGKKKDTSTDSKKKLPKSLQFNIEDLDEKQLYAKILTAERAIKENSSTAELWKEKLPAMKAAHEILVKQRQEQEELAEAARKENVERNKQAAREAEYNDRAILQKGLIGEEAGWNITNRLGETQTQEIVYRYDKETGDLNVSEMPIITNFEQLSKLIMKTDEQIANLEVRLNSNKAAFGKAYDSKHLEAVIASTKNYLKILEDEAKKYGDSDEGADYALNYQNFLKERAENKQFVENNKQDKLAINNAKYENKKSKAIENSNSFLSRQENLLKDIQFLYDKKVNPNAKKGLKDGADLNDLRKKQLDIETKIASLKGTILSQDQKDSIVSEIRDLDRLRKSYTDKLYGATDLSPKELDVSKAIVTNNVDNFIEKLKLAGDYTSSLRTEVETFKSTLNTIGSSNGITEAKHQLKEYDSRFQVLRTQEQARQKENKKANAQITEEYNKNYKAIEKYSEAQDELNKLIGQQIKHGKSEELTSNIVRQTKEVIKLRNEAEKATAAILQMYGAGEISSIDKDIAKDLFNNTRLRKTDSFETLAAIRRDKDKEFQYAGRTKLYEEYLSDMFKDSSIEDAMFKSASVDSTGKGILTFLELVGDRARETKVYLDDVNEALDQMKNGQFDFNAHKTISKWRNATEKDFDGNAYNKVNDRVNAYEQLIKTEDKYQKLSAKVEMEKATTSEIAEFNRLKEVREKYNNIISESIEKLNEEERAVYNSKQAQLQDLQSRYEKQKEDSQLTKKAYMDAYKVNNPQEDVTRAISVVNDKMNTLSKKDGVGYSDYFARQKKEVDALTESLEKGVFTVEEYNKRVGKITSDLDNTIAFIEPNAIDNGRAALEGVIKSMEGAEFTGFKELGNGLYEATGKLHKHKGAVEDISITYSSFNGKIAQTKSVLKDVDTSASIFFTKLKKRFGSLVQYLMTFGSFYEVVGIIRQGVNVVTDLDSALTEMRKVSDESISSLKKFQDESFDVAHNIGSTAKQIQQSAADYMRLGYSLDTASKLAEDANIYANVGDMDIQEATEHMVSSIQAWKSEFENEVEASSAIVDRYNEIGNNFAITSADIGSAMERSAAALKAGGNTLNESLGLITAGKFCLKFMETYFYRTYLIAGNA